MSEQTQKSAPKTRLQKSGGQQQTQRSTAARKPAQRSTTATGTTQRRRPARTTDTKTTGTQQNRQRRQSSGARQGGQRRRQGGRGGSRTNMRNISKNWKKAPSLDGPAPQLQVKKGPRGKNANKLRIAVLGGAEEVGRNMTMIEYGNDIILIDMGLQFPEEEMPGVDYIIPNVSYLKGKEKNIRGVIITHAHYDHIGAIPHLLGRLHNPPIYSARLSLGIIAKRQDDFPLSPKADLREVDVDGQLQLGEFVVEFIRINHSIPDSLAIVVRSPEGTIIHTGDFKFDLQPIGDQVTDFAKLSRLGQEGILALLSDSTNSSKPGQQQSETHIGNTLKEVIAKADGRVIVGTFASNLNRVQQLIWSAEELGRYIVLQGYSMRTNVEIAKQLGYFKVKRDTIISEKEAQKLPNDKVIIVTTGAQGEQNAGLMRIAVGEHRFFKIEKGDTVIFSSSVIPGNERSVQKVKDLLIREGAEVIHYQMMDVHAGGHAQEEDLKLLIRMVQPEYYVPIEGNTHLLYANGQIARKLGYPEDKVFITENGRVMEYAGGSGRLTKEMLPSDYVFVDGLGVGDVSEVVLRDRQALSEDGMLVVIVTVDHKNGEVVGSPDIISRGFVYVKGNSRIIEEVRAQAADIVKPHLKNEEPNAVYLKNKLRDGLGEYIFKKIQRRPMILPVIVEV